MAQWWECLPPTNVAWVRFQPGAICGLSLLLVFALLRVFFSGFSGFLHPAKADMTSSLNYVFFKNKDINVIESQASINSDFTFVFHIRRRSSNFDYENCLPAPLWGQRLNILELNLLSSYCHWISLFPSSRTPSLFSMISFNFVQNCGFYVEIFSCIGWRTCTS